MIRLAKVSDATKIAQIEKECIKCAWSLNTITSALSDSNYIFYIFKDGEEVCGYGSIRLTTPECELNNIAVDKAHRKRGIAKKILDTLITTAKSSGIETMFLEVEKTNDTAIKLYSQFGFSQIAVRKNYYGENLDALIFSKTL